MAKITIHIGLPKTATTTLQYEVFASPENRDIYLGKYESEQSDFHRMITAFLVGAIPYKNARNTVEELAQSEGIYIYSNEMLTVDTDQKWQTKISKLGMLMAGLDVQILVSLRKPSHHVQSVYAELKTTGGWSSLDAFLTDTQASWFDPMEIDKVLKDAGFSPKLRVFYVEFETLIASNFTVLTSLFPELYVPASLLERNARTKENGAIISRPIGIYDVVYGWAKQAGLLTIMPRGVKRYIGMLINRIPLLWSSKIEPVNDKHMLAELDSRYEGALAILQANVLK
jgi:hypothetical protein